MADGSVKIDVGLSTAKAERDLAKLKEKIARAEDQLNANADKKSQLETKLEKAGKAADAARERVKKLQEEYDNSRGSERAKIKVDLDQAKQTYKDNAGDAERLGREYQKVSEDIDKGTQNLAKMKDQAGQLTQQIEKARPGELLSAGIETARKKLMKFIKYAFGIRSVYILFQRLKGYIKDSVKELAEHDSELKKTLDTIKATKKATKLAWGSAFAGIYTAILPVVQKIANWMLEAANAAAKFVAIISGKDTYKRAVVDTTEISENLEDVEESAKEAKKQLMGFDELNILSGDAGGSGSGKSDKSKLDGVRLIEEKIDKLDDSFVMKLGQTVKDVFFDWDDLNPEQIAKKAIAGLAGILGAAVGFSIGGVPGAVVGSILGVTLGLIFDAVFFDHDGVLSKNEIRNLILPALNGLVGGIAGFVFSGGSRLGALVGAAAGVGLTILFEKAVMQMDNNVKLNKDKIAKILTIIGGGIIGFKIGSVGGLGGAVVGAIIGTLAASLLVTIVSASIDKGSENIYRSSELAQEMRDMKERLESIMEQNANLRVHINSITGEVDSNTMASLAAAQSLIDSIFTLDAKSNKTSEEAALLREQIELLNSLGLDGIQLGFDETTGHVQGTRQEIQGLLDDLLVQYQIEAMKEAYIDAFKAQYEATESITKATDEATRASQDYDTAVRNLAEAENTYNQAVRDYSKYINYGVTDPRLTAAQEALAAAREGVEQTKANAEDAKTALETALSNADLAAEKVTGIGTALTDLVTTAQDSGKAFDEGFTGEIEKNSALAGDAAKEMGQKALDELSTALDAHSPSKETEKRGRWAVEGFESGITDETPKAVAAVKDMMELIYQELNTNLEKIKGLMNFSWSLPRPKIPQIGWNIRTVGYGRGQSVSIPQFFVNWYARGGVFDFPQLIGVGENGKEAVVPLEKNTEWMQTVADGLMERIERSRFADKLAEAFASTPRPAMASGSVVPPNAVGGSGISQDSMQQAIERGVYNAIMALGGMPKSRGGFILDVNGREFARATYSDYKAVENEHGISLIES